MNRIISLLSCLVIVVTCFAVPVFADTNLGEGQLIDLVDYGNSVESDTNSLAFTGSTSLNFVTPFVGQISYIDVVFRFWSTSGSKLDNVVVLRHGEELTNIRFSQLHGQYYRAFGTFTTRAFANIGLKFLASNNNPSSYVSISSFKVGLFGSTTRETDGRVYIDAHNYTKVLDHLPGEGENTFDSWTGSTEWDEQGYLIELSCPNNWMKYDFMDYIFLLNVASINSIVVEQNGVPVPFEVSYLDNNPSAELGYYFVHIRVDQRNVNRTYLGHVPTVAVSGQVSRDALNSIIVSDVFGHIEYVVENPVIFWFKKTFASMDAGFNNVVSGLTTGFNNVVNAITGGSEDVNNVGNQMQSAADGLNQSANAFDQVEKPDINASDLTGDFTNFSPSGLTVLATITNNSYVTALLVLVFTFALCAYIFFGRKR